MIAKPKDFRRRKTGQCGICHHFEQLLAPPRTPLDLATFLRGALVVPQNRWPNYTVEFVQKDRAVHLSTQANALDASVLSILARLRELCHCSANTRNRRAPPFIRILFRPTRLRMVRCVRGCRGRSNGSSSITQKCSSARGTHVDSQIKRHESLSS